MILLNLFMSLWTIMLVVEMIALRHALRHRDLLKLERQSWSTIAAAVLTVFSASALLPIWMYMLRDQGGTGMAYWIFAGRKWLHGLYLLITVLLFILIIIPPASPRITSAFLVRVMAFCTNCMATFAIIMGFQTR